MKHWNLAAVLLTAAVIFAGCQGDDTKTVKTKDGKELEGPAEYNDYLVQRQNEVIGKFRELNEAYDQFDKEEIQEHHSQLEDAIDKAVSDIEELPPYSEGGNLRNAALEMFKYYEQLSKNDFRRIGEIVSQGKENIPDNEIDEVDSLFNQFRKDIQSYEVNFADAQKSFAKEHEMKIKQKGK